METEEWLKINFIGIARTHKKHCDGKNCPVSLVSLAIALNRLGVKLSDEEIKEFL